MPRAYHPVTIVDTDDSAVMSIVEQCADRFHRLNGVAPQIITAADMKGIEYDRFRAAYTRAWLWDLVPTTVERILYYDWDIIPVRPLGAPPKGRFAAVLGPGVGHMRKVFDFVRKTGVFFNAGLFLAERSTRPIFEQLKTFCAHAGGFDNQQEQMPLNLLAQQQVGVTLLPEEWNYMVFMTRNFIARPKMIHLTGCLPKGWKLFRILLDLLDSTETRESLNRIMAGIRHGTAADSPEQSSSG